MICSEGTDGTFPLPLGEKAARPEAEPGEEPYIVDFICFEHKLIIELDGGQHIDSVKDRRRDEWMRSEGYSVIRFWNDDALKRTEIVLEEISRALARSDTPLPARSARHPLPQGERETQHRR